MQSRSPVRGMLHGLAPGQHGFHRNHTPNHLEGGDMSTATNHIAAHKLGPLGAQPELSEMNQMVQQSVHRYAEEVMRPIGVKLDRMTPKRAIPQASPDWEAAAT